MGSAARHRQSIVVAAVGALVYLVIVVVLAATHGGTGEWFVKFGTASSVTSYGKQVLGPDLVVPFDEAQDGSAFWLQARDPLLIHPTPLATYTDRPAYRADRMLYPALVSPFHLFGEQALVWGLVIVNLGVVFVGGYLTTRLALELGAPARAGYAFAANPLVLAAIVLDLADALALAAIVGAVWAARRQRWTVAVAFAVAAVMTKESSLLALGGLALGLPGRPPRFRVALVAVPAVVFGSWALYVRSRLSIGASQVQEVSIVPFGGYSEAWRLGWSVEGRWGDAMVAGLLLVVSVVVIVRWARRRTPELWASLPFALLVPFLTSQVLRWSINSVRAVGPVLTLLALDVAAERAARARSADELTPAP